MGDLLKLAVLSGSAIMFMILMIPFVGIMTHHRRKLEELRMRQTASIADETRAAIEAVRKEVEALRDTATQYDVSFDAALHRIDSRVGNLEQRMQHVERKQETVRLGVGQEDVRAGI